MHNHCSKQSPPTSIHFCQHSTWFWILFLKKYSSFSWNHWCTVAFLLKLLYPTSKYAYINTFISVHWLHMLMNVDGRNCSAVKKSVTAHSLKRTSSISTGTEQELCIAVGWRLRMVEGRNCVNVWNWFYAVFSTLIKNITQVLQSFKSSL